MSDCSIELAGEAHSSTLTWDVLERLTDVGDRMAGHGGEEAAAGLVRDRFEHLGLRNVSTTAFEIPVWWRGSSSLTVTTDSTTRTFESDAHVIALPGTPARDLTADLVDVGCGTEAEFDSTAVEGRVTLVSAGMPDDHDQYLHRTEKYDLAVESGAVGFVFSTTTEGCLPQTGTIGDNEGEIPAVGVSSELGNRLGRHCDAGDPTVELAIECERTDGTSRYVEGVLGPDTDREVLVTCHVDSHDIAEGAIDNGTGTALVVEVARLLSTALDRLGTAVRFVAFGAEEIGLFGSKTWADNAELDAVKCVINVDCAGASPTLYVGTHGFDSIRTVFEEVSAQRDADVEIDDRVIPHSDHWPVVREGVPGAIVMSHDVDGAWAHTHADTLDKLDVRHLRHAALQLALATLNASERDREMPREDAERVRELAGE